MNTRIGKHWRKKMPAISASGKAKGCVDKKYPPYFCREKVDNIARPFAPQREQATVQPKRRPVLPKTSAIIFSAEFPFHAVLSQFFVWENKYLPAIMKRIYFLKCDRISYVALNGLAYLQFGKINHFYIFIGYFINFYFSIDRHGCRSWLAVIQQQFDSLILFRNRSDFAYNIFPWDVIIRVSIGGRLKNK